MRMPLKDDAAIKEYVLRPPHRAQLLSSACFSTQPNCLKGQGSCTRQGTRSRQGCTTDQGCSTGQGISSGQGYCLSEGCFPRQNASMQGCQGCPHCTHTRAVAASGATWRSVAGADGIQPLLMEPSFVCMHYKLGPGAQLQACVPEMKGSEDSVREQYARYSMLTKHKACLAMHTTLLLSTLCFGLLNVSSIHVALAQVVKVVGRPS